MIGRLFRITTLLICVISLWAGFLNPWGPGPSLALESARESVVIETLENGLTVILAPKAGSPVATVNVWIGVGSAQEPPALNGIAHFFEHMIFKGSAQYAQVDAVVEGWGGTSNASTSLDFTEYYVSVPSEHIEPAIDLVADILINGLFPEEELVKEREVVLREGDQREDDPDAYFAYQVWNTFYGDHPYGQPILGTEETVARLTRDDFLAWLKTWYVPNNMTVIVAGGFDPDRVLSQVETHFGVMKARALPSFAPSAPRPGVNQAPVILTRDIEQERLLMAWLGPPVEEFDDVVAMDVLLYLLSGGRSSRLYRNVIRDLGTITDASANYFTTRLPAIFSLSAQYPPSQTEVARSALLHEMERLLDGHVTPAEIETAKTVLVAQTELDAESSSGLAHYLGFYATVTGNPRDTFRYVDLIRQIRVEDVVAVARKYITLGEQMEFRMTPAAVGSAAIPVSREGYLTLDNGLQLILREDPSTNVVAFETFVGTGTAVETAAQAGISSFTNTLMLLGTATRTEEEIFAVIENLGASLSQAQLPDMANLSLTATADTWPDALPVYLDVLMNPAFTAENFNRLQRDTLLQIEAERESHFTTIYNQLLAALYGDSGYGNPELGTVESIEALTLEEVQDFYDHHYVPENMVVAVVGNINADLMAARLGTELETLNPAHGPIERGSRHIRLETPRTVTTEHAEANLAWLVMGFPGPAVQDADYAPMKILNSIVGSGASSRMFRIVRDEQGLAYAAGSFFPSRAEHSHLAVYAIVLPEYRETVTKVILDILYDIRDHGVSEEELSLAIQRELGDFILNHETAAERAFDLGWYAMLGAGHAVGVEYPARIRSVTSEDVQRVAAQYLDNYVISVLFPPQ